MIIVKFIVLFGCIAVLSALQTYYCDICTNHTLCLYDQSGPSEACHSYDRTALLSNHDIYDIVHKINERRNYIASGQSKLLPQAANMKKIHWSAELATIAQRWADQCDPYLNPDRHDVCRDLDNTEVGQNIGSIVGASPGLNIRSFVDMWFMQILEYSGTVTFYNQSNRKTDYLTQLIWADTTLVGCGKTKFYVVDKNVIVERLVCNFAPRGNINRRPVYIIGYAGTQCPDKMVPDEQYRGLCDYVKNNTVKKSDTTSSEKSLLRILNLSNNSHTGDIDPTQNDFKESKLKRKRPRSQKIRHIRPDYNSGTVRRTLIRKQNYGKSFAQNMSKNMNDDHYHQYERGHSRLYHGYEEADVHEPTPKLDSITNYFHRDNNKDSHKYESSTYNYLISRPNLRKNMDNQLCTRGNHPIPPQQHNCCNNQQCTTHRCCHERPTTFQSETFTNPIIPDQWCPCIKTFKCPITCTPRPTTVNCCNGNFCNGNCVSYAHVPDMVRSGDHETTSDVYSHKQFTKLFGEPKQKKTFNNNNGKELNDDFSDDINEDIDQSKYHVQDSDYLHRSFDPNRRKKRDDENNFTLKPFWKMNELSITPKKIVKYTTMSHIKNRKTNRYVGVTEPITINREHYTNNDLIPDALNNDVSATEKYLSFDQLLHLRKFSGNNMDYNHRRQANKKTTAKATTTVKKTTAKATTTAKKTIAKATIAKTTTTKKIDPPKQPIAFLNAVQQQPSSKMPNFTANTAFARKKHCTRKLTCTWTAFTGEVQNGENLIKEFGSRTPPGYVEGCSRTSTCTRNNLNKNKPATTVGLTGDLDQSVDDTSSHNDDDYCEKRSLNIRKRNVVMKNSNKILVTGYSSMKSKSKGYTGENNGINGENIKTKRRKRTPASDVTNLQTYSDLYNLILNKFLRPSHNSLCDSKKCPCNGTVSQNRYILLLYLINYIMQIIQQ